MKTRFLNNICKAVAIVTIVGSLSSCEDFLTVPAKSKFDSENVFLSVEGARMAVYGAYVSMAHPMYGRKVVTMLNVDTDEMRVSGGWDIVGRQNFARYSSTPASVNSELYSLWQKWYQCIERCNVVLHNIPEMDLYENGSETERAELRRLVGEAYCLRAWCYHDLIKHWGDVPFTTEASKAGDVFYTDRTPRDQIYDHIIEDLRMAVELMPWRKEVALEARFTKGAAKALRARIALQAAGYSLRWNLEDGSNLGMRTRDDQARIRELYQIARDECNDVIKDPNANHRLNPVFENIWKSVCNSQLDGEFGESMFELGMYNPETNASQANGNIGYNIGTKSGDQNPYGKSSPEVRLIPTYVHSFDKLDVRRKTAVGDIEAEKNTGYGVIINGMWDYTPGKWRAWWYNNGNGYMNQYTNINWVLLRYADVLLMFAEAENKLNGGPTADGIDALKQVRKRAFAGNESVIDSENYTGMPEDEFLEVIVNERWWELGAEAVRKYDLIRWNKLGERIRWTKEELERYATMANSSTEVPRYLFYRVATDLKVADPEVGYTSDGSDPLYPTTGDNPWIRRNYRNSLSGNEHTMVIFARDFTDNKTELYPIPQSVCDENPLISQHPSYK